MFRPDRSGAARRRERRHARGGRSPETGDGGGTERSRPGRGAGAGLCLAARLGRCAQDGAGPRGAVPRQSGGGRSRREHPRANRRYRRRGRGISRADAAAAQVRSGVVALCGLSGPRGGPGRRAHLAGDRAVARAGQSHLSRGPGQARLRDERGRCGDRDRPRLRRAAAGFLERDGGAGARLRPAPARGDRPADADAERASGDDRGGAARRADLRRGQAPGGAADADVLDRRPRQGHGAPASGSRT